MATIERADAAAQAQGGIPTRSQIEDFLYLEAALLDEWKLDEWLALFAEGATYDVPTTRAEDDADSADQLFLVADDYARLQHRVRRLKKPGAHSEWPRSRTAHSITNVRIVAVEGDELLVRSLFITYRAKNDVTDCYFGHHIHRIRAGADGLKILSKRSMLDMSSLRPHGRVSIIV
ncbi:aromatic-ring-hydroxylating dioxygenase subunit beta [Rhizorhabdus dicambivorans]|uniref:Aromatic-ring-hydroxylating dioxygenase subunit beta n=1 Tax=Rhizorhabdus dicambivorans TaxID=1850238 RepID=A0A2A4FZ53_9SPHN|nr:aromatic-ring-hydroxylating dioxygenase subunit beta [Rhizorhabdus dicambivorans]ATE63651.1 aromatic-ring-hydroxylating dioxygenase subunit beta [Rhizorhabdus dicambivorans]PCE42779.1 aromatic-ring-hydroxylating dioxygenase subunit beta [Rhizorhabdus dicambivorans]